VSCHRLTTLLNQTLGFGATARMLKAKAPWLGDDARVDGTLGVMSHCDAMKAGVVGRQRYKGTAVKWLNCIHIECSNDWEEMATFPDAAGIMTSKGTIGFILGSSCRLPPQAAV
jgi:hypothetical protein